MTSDKKPRIALLVPHSGMSGAEINIAHLLRGISPDRFEIHVIAPAAQPLLKIARENGHLADEYEFPRFYSTSIETARFRLFNPFSTALDLLIVAQLAFRLSRLLEKNKIDVLYAGSMMAHLTGMLLRIVHPKTRVVIHLQDIIAPRLARGLGRPGFGLVTRIVDKVIACSKSVEESLVYKKNVVLVFNGVDPRIYSAIENSTLRQELKAGPQTALVGIVGRLAPWKGHKLFLEAASRLGKEGADCQFVVVGDDIDPVTGQSHYRPQLEAYAAELGLNGKATFLGLRKDIPNVMRGLDILVVPSTLPDPFPLVPLEGMASAKPVIGARNGGIAEIIDDNVTGRLFQPGDVDGLVGCLRELIGDPAKRVQYGQAGLHRIESKFTLNAYINGIVSVFEQLGSSRKS